MKKKKLNFIKIKLNNNIKYLIFKIKKLIYIRKIILLKELIWINKKKKKVK